MMPRDEPLWSRALRARKRITRLKHGRSVVDPAVRCALCGMRRQESSRRFVTARDGLRCHICAETRLAEIALD